MLRTHEAGTLRASDIGTDVIGGNRQGLADLVHLLGHSDRIGDLLAAADVFAFPSRFEGFAGAVLEAFAVGTPVVASDIAGRLPGRRPDHRRGSRRAPG